METWQLCWVSAALHVTKTIFQIRHWSAFVKKLVNRCLMNLLYWVTSQNHLPSWDSILLHLGTLPHSTPTDPACFQSGLWSREQGNMAAIFQTHWSLGLVSIASHMHVYERPLDVHKGEEFCHLSAITWASLLHFRHGKWGKTDFPPRIVRTKCALQCSDFSKDSPGFGLFTSSVSALPLIFF
jgi:hypothetical protein